MPYSEEDKAALSKKRGQAGALISDPAQKQKFTEAQGAAESKKGGASDDDYRKLDKEADDTLATGGTNVAVGTPSYKHGTDYVPKTGLALLHKGEKVVPAKDNKKNDPFAALSDVLGGAAKPPAPEKALKHIVHTRSANGGHILTHHYTHPDTHKEEAHTFDNHDDMLNHVMEHMTDANEGEDDNYKEPMDAEK